jgi:hypothetical protein
MSDQYRKISIAVTLLTFADKEHTGPECGISRGETNEYPLWTSLLESSAAISLLACFIA